MFFDDFLDDYRFFVVGFWLRILFIADLLVCRAAIRRIMMLGGGLVVFIEHRVASIPTETNHHACSTTADKIIHERILFTW